MPRPFLKTSMALLAGAIFIYLVLLMFEVRLSVKDDLATVLVLAFA